jgi:serine/threonine protein kinase
MGQTSSCPDFALLRRSFESLLTDQEQAELAAHLEECDVCQAAIEELACGDGFLPGHLRALAQGPTGNPPGLKRVIDVLRDEFESTAAQAEPPTDSEELLKLLDPPDPDSPGDLGKLGTYRVTQVLGQGGMGIVLKAFDPALLRPVAIKVLAPQLATSSSARQRFAREARAAAAIRNEHVVAIHSVDEWKGLPYLVMEFIPGTSLQERIDRTAPLDLDSILRIGMQTASGLAAAHAQGLVHRDIKPSNILLENCVERVKITDFGLARAVDDASLTQSGVVAGTPLFMAPEQARCESIDHRADLFSLGAVLYAMCTGRSPFRASTTLGVLRRVCDETHRPVREVNPDIPDWLAALIDRLLEKDRARRYQTASVVAEELNRHLARRQRGVSDEAEPRPAPAAQGLATLDDVGPAKGLELQSLRLWFDRHGEMPDRRRRLLEILGYLLVLLAGLFVVTEVTGVTRVVETLAHVLGRRPKSSLVIHNSDPRRFTVRVNDIPYPAVGRFYDAFDPWISGCSVDVFEGDRRIEGMCLSLKPGLSIEMNVDQDGHLTIEHEGWVRTPKPGRETAEKPIVQNTRPHGPDGLPSDPREEHGPRAEDDNAPSLLVAARAALAKAVAQRDSSAGELSRIESLAKHGAISVAERDASRHRLAVAEAERRAAEADLAAAEARQKAAEIKRQLAALGLQQFSPIPSPPRNPDPALPDNRFEELSLNYLRSFRDIASAQVTQAKALLEKATANRDYLKRQLRRTRQLHQQGAVPSQDLLDAETRLAGAEADIPVTLNHLAEAEARVKAAEAGLRAYTDRSPAANHK